MGIGAAIARLCAPWSLGLFDLKIADLRYRARPPLAPGPEVAIVGLDERSLATVGRWPWPRTRTADLIAAITRAHPAAIGVDIVFDHRDQAIDGDVLEDTVRGSPHADAESVLARVRGIGDRRLSEALHESGRTVLAYFFELDGEPSPALTQELAGLPELSVRALAGTDVAAVPYLADARRVHRPLTDFLTATGNAGHINYLPDDDGVYRRGPLAIRAGDRIFPAFDVQLVRAALDGAPATIVLAPSEVAALTIAGAPLPVDGDAEVWLNYLGPPHTFPHFAAADVLAGAVPADALAGRIVLVGFTAAGFDDVTTPFAPVAPGVEVHATGIDNLLRGRALWRPWWGVPLEALVLVWAGAFTGAAVRRWRGLGAALGAGAVVLAYLAGTQALFIRWGLVLGAMYPLVGTFFCALAGVAFQATALEREKRHIRDAFGRYLNPEVIELVAADPRRLHLGGDRSEITVLFSDIRGFTTISERLAPEVLGDFLKEYLSAMTEIVFKHDGLLDKYVGDAVMAFWGAPIAVADHAARCCAAALEMQSALERLNADWATRGLPVIKIGIGINTGSAIVGNFGSERRFSYTAVGDTVNLASRLEHLNKDYGTRVLVSDATRAAIDGGFELRPVGEVTVRGRQGSTGIFELLGRREA